MIGAQVSSEQVEKILSPIDLGKEKAGAPGGRQPQPPPERRLCGLGTGVWAQDTAKAYRMGRRLQAERLWTNPIPVPGAYSFDYRRDTEQRRQVPLQRPRGCAPSPVPALQRRRMGGPHPRFMIRPCVPFNGPGAKKRGRIEAPPGARRGGLSAGAPRGDRCPRADPGPALRCGRRCAPWRVGGR